MDSSRRLTEALRRQFDWVPILVFRRAGVPAAERRQAMLFCTMHVCLSALVFVHAVTVVASWVFSIFLQLIAVSFATVYLSYLRRYQDKAVEAVEVERLGNPLLIAQITIRGICVAQALLMGSKHIFLLGLLDVAYNWYVARSPRSLLLDATSLWREIDRRSWDALVRLGYQVAMTLAAIAYFLFCMIVFVEE